MKRTYKYALSAVLLAAMVVPTFAAQDSEQFPDTPDNHWVYESLLDLKKAGWLVGYPDGLYRGGRPASRYELAAALHSAYQAMKNAQAGLDSQLAALSEKLDSMSGGTGTGSGVTKEEIDNIRTAISALQNDLSNLRSQDLAEMKRMADTFKQELASMGVDVEAMKGDIADLKSRVEKLEKHKPAVDIHGDANMVMLAGYSDAPVAGLDVTGRPLGIGNSSSGLVGGSTDLTMFHEAALRFSSTNETGPKFNATFVMNNMIGSEDHDLISGGEATGFHSMSSTNEGVAYNEGISTTYLYEFAVNFNTSIAGLGFNAEVGRIGVQAGSMMFKRVDTTPYYSNERWDNGNHIVDGANLGFMFGKVGLNVFGGTTNASVNGYDDVEGSILFAPIFVGATDFSGGRPIGFTTEDLRIDRVLGTKVNIPLGEKGGVNLAYLWLDSDDTSTTAVGGTYNRMNVWGGDVKFDLGMFNIDGGYSQSDYMFNNDSIVNEDNSAWWVNAGFGGAKWNAKVGYRVIEPLYAAPGDWGRIGIWWNPTDLEGFNAKLHFDINDKFGICAMGEWYRGADTDSSAAVSGLTDDDKVNHYCANLSFKPSSTTHFDLGYELVDWDLTGGTSPQERWWNIGAGVQLSDMATWSILWQISDYDGDGNGGFDVNGDNTAKGGLITSQLSFKF